MKEILIKLKNDPRVKNSLWMFIEKAISLFGLIFILSAVAKYTGPSIYGEISLAASIFVVVKAIAQLGMDQIYYKYVSEQKPYYDIFFNNSLRVISIIYALIFFLILIFAYLYSNNMSFYFILATGIAYYFNSIDVVNYYFEAKLISKINVMANICGLTVSLFFRYFVVYFDLNVLYLCAPIVLMTVIPFYIKYHVYKKNYACKSRTSSNKKTLKYAGIFMATGIPITLSVLTVTLNSQVAYYLLAYFWEVKKVAIYSVAFTLSGAWCIVPTTIIMSYLAGIYNDNVYSNYLVQAKKLFKIVFYVSTFIVLFLFISSEYIIQYLYGDDYSESVKVFKILLIYQMLWVVGFYFSRLIIKFNGYRFLAYKAVIMVLLNFILAAYLIKNNGAIGAAYAALILELISVLVINLFYRKASLTSVLLFFRKGNEL